MRRPAPQPSAPAEKSPQDQTPNAGPFDVRGLTTYELTLAADDWNELVRSPHANQWYRCAMRWRGETLEDVGIRASGQVTRIPENPKPSMRVSFSHFNKDRHLHGVAGFKFDALKADPSMLHERLAYGVYRDAGLPAPREAHARVLVNGELKGLYAVEERIDHKFLK